MHITDSENGTIRLDFNCKSKSMKRKYKQSLGIFRNDSTNHLNLTFCLLVFFMYIVLNYLICLSLYIVHNDFVIFLFVYTLLGKRGSQLEKILLI